MSAAATSALVPMVGGMELVTIARRPELAEAAFAIPYREATAAFMQGDPVAALVRRTRLARRWPHLTVVAVDGGECVARGVCVPFAADPADIAGRVRFPDGGWDQVAIWAVEDAMDDRETDTVCAIEIAVHPARQRGGLSTEVLRAMRAVAGELGHDELVVPVRPPGKADEPWTSIGEYAARTRPDGLPADPWLRVHARLGGTVVGIAPCSSTVQAPLARWRAWTGLPFDTDDPVAVPGGMVPVLVSQLTDVGVYVEPNVWFSHPTG